MVGGLVAVGLAFWFHVSAEAKGLNPWKWVFISLAVYFGTLFVWVMLVGGPMMTQAIYARSLKMGSLSVYSGIAVGAIVVAIVRFKYLRKPKDKNS